MLPSAITHRTRKRAAGEGAPGSLAELQEAKCAWLTCMRKREAPEQSNALQWK